MTRVDFEYRKRDNWRKWLKGGRNYWPFDGEWSQVSMQMEIASMKMKNKKNEKNSHVENNKWKKNKNIKNRICKFKSSNFEQRFLEFEFNVLCGYICGYLRGFL